MSRPAGARGLKRVVLGTNAANVAEKGAIPFYFPKFHTGEKNEYHGFSIR